ncbi:hypothetical protein ACP6PK_19645 [Dapis sp. BLCC M172]
MAIRPYQGVDTLSVSLTHRRNAHGRINVSKGRIMDGSKMLPLLIIDRLIQQANFPVSDRLYIEILIAARENQIIQIKQK